MEEKRQKDALREQEIGTCSECNQVYPWSKLQDESTQEYAYVICINCRARRDPRLYGGSDGTHC